MSNIWFTSDLHLGHAFAAEQRGFNSVEDHDSFIIESFNSHVGRRDKVFILGDLAFSSNGLKNAGYLSGTKELIFGNHDTYSLDKYLNVVDKVHGFRRYNNFWLSHCPIHPQEMYRCRGNLHGHIHKGAATPELYLPYFNVNVEFNNFNPVNLDRIEEIYNG